MRYIKDIPNEYCKTSLYSFNNKFIIKFEGGAYEQVYKVDEMDVSSIDEVEEMLGDSFYKTVIGRFESMQTDFEEIIDSID